MKELHCSPRTATILARGGLRYRSEVQIGVSNELDHLSGNCLQDPTLHAQTADPERHGHVDYCRAYARCVAQHLVGKGPALD